MAGDKLAGFWCRRFEEAHEFPPMFEKRDGVILHKIRAHYADDVALAWAIRKYMKDDDAFIRRAGWSTQVFKLRAQGYIAEFYRRYPRRLPQPVADVIDLMLERHKREGRDVGIE